MLRKLGEMIVTIQIPPRAMAAYFERFPRFELKRSKIVLSMFVG